MLNFQSMVYQFHNFHYILEDKFDLISNLQDEYIYVIGFVGGSFIWLMS